MHRAYLLIVVAIALAAPGVSNTGWAADKPPVMPPRLVARIDSLMASRSGGNVVIEVRGAVESGGWHQARLRPLKPGANDAHSIVVEFVATPPPPTQAVIMGLLPVSAYASLRMRRDIVSVRVISGSNEITTEILK